MAYGTGSMAVALRAAGARGYASDIVDRGNGQDAVLRSQRSNTCRDAVEDEGAVHE
jgi:hypothetical protein